MLRGTLAAIILIFSIQSSGSLTGQRKDSAHRQHIADLRLKGFFDWYIRNKKANTGRTHAASIKYLDRDGQPRARYWRRYQEKFGHRSPPSQQPRQDPPTPHASEVAQQRTSPPQTFAAAAAQANEQMALAPRTEQRQMRPQLTQGCRDSLTSGLRNLKSAIASTRKPRCQHVVSNTPWKGEPFKQKARRECGLAGLRIKRAMEKGVKSCLDTCGKKKEFACTAEPDSLRHLEAMVSAALRRGQPTENRQVANLRQQQRQQRQQVGWTNQPPPTSAR